LKGTFGLKGLNFSFFSIHVKRVFCKNNFIDLFVVTKNMV